jgi:hypothetical protein
MALKKAVNFRGVQAEYWAIIQKRWNKFGNTTSGDLGLYVSRQTREDSETQNILKLVSFAFIGELSRAEVYTELKKSRPVITIIRQATEDEEAVTVTTETNELFGAEDV